MLFPVPWSGLRCAAQCNKVCKDDGPAGPGEFRFVVRACGASNVALAGPTFTLPRLSGGQLVRWRTAQGISSATATRLDQPDRLDMDAPPTEGKLLGFTKRAGPARALAPAALDALRVALTNKDGFDDMIVNRCLMEHFVGFQLTRDAAASSYGEPGDADHGHKITTDVVIDFNCQRIYVSARAGSTRLGERAPSKRTLEMSLPGQPPPPPSPGDVLVFR